mmetsp:Transcript_64328/g.152221  ORF Transcript_64328/g.152221 Transcript_64328/m.152221 type:complete len:211 (+) Transcript_64328:73-705(+)
MECPGFMSALALSDGGLGRCMCIGLSPRYRSVNSSRSLACGCTTTSPSPTCPNSRLSNTSDPCSTMTMLSGCRLSSATTPQNIASPSPSPTACSGGPKNDCDARKEADRLGVSSPSPSASGGTLAAWLPSLSTWSPSTTVAEVPLSTPSRRRARSCMLPAARSSRTSRIDGKLCSNSSSESLLRENSCVYSFAITVAVRFCGEMHAISPK